MGLVAIMAVSTLFLHHRHCSWTCGVIAFGLHGWSFWPRCRVCSHQPLLLLLFQQTPTFPPSCFAHVATLADSSLRFHFVWANGGGSPVPSW